MKLIHYISFCIVFIFNTIDVAVAQNRTVTDSLESAFVISKNHQEKALILFELSNYWSYRDTAVAFNKLSLSDRYIGQNEYLKALRTFYTAGIWFGHNNSLSESLYLKADSLLLMYNTKEAYEYRAKAWHNFATIQQMKGDNTTFLNLTINKCIPIAELSGNQSLISGYYSDIGIIFNNMKEYEKAITYFEKALNILEKANIKDENYIWGQLNLSESYLRTSQIDKAKVTLNEAESTLKSLPESQFNSILSLHKARYENAVGNHLKSYQLLEEGIAFASHMNLDFDVLNMTYEKIQMQKKNGLLLDAKNGLEALLNKKKYLANKNNHLHFLTEIIDIESQLGNYKKALAYQQQYQTIKDSLQADNEKTHLLDIEMKYNASEKEKQLLILQNKSNKSKLVFWAATIILILTTLFLVYVIVQRKKKSKQALEHLERQKKDEVEKALKIGEQQERIRLAKELHDGLGGQIIGVKIKLENVIENHPDSTLSNVVGHLDSVLNELRQTARNLMPETLTKFGLKEALSDFCLNLNQKNIKIVFYHQNLHKIEDTQHQINIYRIIQELVGNSLRHANATKILVQCTYQNELLLIDVEDNGKGFDKHTNIRNLGLNNIETRVKSLNGRLTIDTEPNKGTTVSIEAQINNSNKR